MYKDTTLFGATKARNRLERNIMNNKKQEVIQHRNLEKLGKKREMVKELYKTYQSIFKIHIISSKTDRERS